MQLKLQFKLVSRESIDIPANCTTGAWVCAASGGHKFTCVLEQAVESVTLSTDVMVQGSFHYESIVEQREDATVDANEVIFTSLSEIQEFNQINSSFLYLGRYDDLTFAFSSRARLYEQADLYHYRGKALFSTKVTQVIDDPSTFNPTLIVSNSLPIWLYMPIYVPPYPGFTCPFPLYPSYLVSENLLPPFGAVHIEGCPEAGNASISGTQVAIFTSMSVCAKTIFTALTMKWLLLFSILSETVFA